MQRLAFHKSTVQYKSAHNLDLDNELIHFQSNWKVELYSAHIYVSRETEIKSLQNTIVQHKCIAASVHSRAVE